MGRSYFDDAVANIQGCIPSWPYSKDETLALLKIIFHVVSQKGKKTRRTPLGTPLVWKVFEEAYLAKYQVKPLINAKQMGLCANLVRLTGGHEPAIELVKYYLAQNDAYYVRSHHKLEILISDYQKLHTSLATGNKVSYKAAAALESKSSTEAAILAHLKEKVTK